MPRQKPPLVWKLRWDEPTKTRPGVLGRVGQAGNGPLLDIKRIRPLPFGEMRDVGIPFLHLHFQIGG